MRRLLIPLLYCSPFTLAQPLATVQGVVTNSVTHAGIGGVAVTLWTQQAVRYNGTTDEAGAWRIAGVKPGRYYSRFDKAGFVEPPHEGPLGQAPLAVGAGVNPIEVDSTLDPLATVRGRVLDPDGKPAAGIEVGINAFVSVKTDADGEFVLGEVRPGSYTLFAKPKPDPDQRIERTKTVTTFYPSAIDRAQVAPVLVRGGDDLPGFEIRLRTSPVYRIRGVVLDDGGKPLPEATVKLLSKSSEHPLAGQMTFAGTVRYYFGSPGLETEEASALSGADGSFEFPSVIPAEWQLRAEAEPKRDSRQALSLNWSGAIPAAITDHDLSDVQIRFPATFTLEVTSDWGDQPPPPESLRRSLVTALLLIPADAGGTAVPHLPNGNGEVSRFENVAEGRYRIVPLAGFLPGYYPAAVLVEGRDILGQPVELTRGTPPLRIVFKPNAGMIRDTVENGAGATVLLWPQSDSTLNLVRAVQAGTGGAFEFPSLAPDSYYVLAIDRQTLENEAESVIRSFPSSATRVQVDVNGSPAIALPLMHLPE